MCKVTAHNHALQTLLWSEEIEAGTSISSGLIHRIRQDWDSFRAQAELIGFDAVEHRAMMIDPNQGDEWDYAAHDFILTRNHHGAGFWDGDWHAPWGDKLTTLAHSFPSIEVYLDDNNILQMY